MAENKNKNKTKTKSKTHFEKGECKGCIYRTRDWHIDSACNYLVRTGERRHNDDNGKCACKKLKEN